VADYDTAIFDVDGTLVDTNYHHALAWFRAFRRHDLTVPVWRLHRAIGMGGDHVVPAVAGDEVEKRLGEQLRADWSDEFDALLGEVQPFEGVRELLADVRRRGFTLVLASSGKAEHVDHYLSLFGGAELAEAWTTSADVEQTKPAPDLLQAALEKVGGRSAVLVGESVWDFRAGARLGVPGYGLLTGGFSAAELRAAGALDVFESPAQLHGLLEQTAMCAGN
jgi:phosphoglycolate phosphatase-like HAD superfamily hydrolase